MIKVVCWGGPSDNWLCSYALAWLSISSIIIKQDIHLISSLWLPSLCFALWQASTHNFGHACLERVGSIEACLVVDTGKGPAFEQCTKFYNARTGFNDLLWSDLELCQLHSVRVLLKVLARVGWRGWLMKAQKQPEIENSFIPAVERKNKTTVLRRWSLLALSFIAYFLKRTAQVPLAFPVQEVVTLASSAIVVERIVSCPARNYGKATRQMLAVCEDKWFQTTCKTE